MITPRDLADHYVRRLEEAAQQVREMRIDAHSIADAIGEKIDLERLLRRMARDLKELRITPRS